MSSVFCVFTRSGVKPGTSDPGAPVLPPGGVIPPGPEKVGDVRRAMVILKAEGDVLAGHVVEVSTRRIPRLGKGWPGFSVKYGVPEAAVAPLSGGSNSPGRASGVVDLAAAERHAVKVFVQPEAVVEHVTEKAPASAPCSRIATAQLTPPPCSQPMSPVTENAILSIRRSGFR